MTERIASRWQSITGVQTFCALTHTTQRFKKWSLAMCVTEQTAIRDTNKLKDWAFNRRTR